MRIIVFRAGQIDRAPAGESRCADPDHGVVVRAAEIFGVRLPLGSVKRARPGRYVSNDRHTVQSFIDANDSPSSIIEHRDCWYHIGDLARVDGKRHVFIVGRKKDLIIRGGFNVYPADVEGVLLEHPAISQVAVVGVPDPVYGEEVKAFVTKSPGPSLDAADVVTWARNDMAAHKYPRLVEFREVLPLGPTGKVLKRMLA